MTRPSLPDRITSRADLEILLARATNYEELRSRNPVRPVFKLDRVAAMLASVGDPQRGPVTVHVAGSKGKGSTARMIATGLQRAGSGPVGLYTSPHLEDLAERVAVDGAPASDDELAHAADRLLPHVKRVFGTERAVTFFEMLTGIAWIVFRKRGCRHVVLEAGLGGRLDATNVCSPTLTLITSIELEHTDVLGSTVELIAAEKAGILKPGVAAATAAEGAARDVIQARADEIGAPLATLGRDLCVSDVRRTAEGGTAFRLSFSERSRPLDLVLPIVGAHHASNAALATWALGRLGVDDETIASALADLALPGVVESLGGDPLVVVDGAHTAVSARHTHAAVEGSWPGRRRVLLVAMLAGKDPAKIASVLLPGTDHVVATELPTPRAIPAADLAAVFRERAPGGVVVEAVADRPEALEAARRAAGPGGLVLATGSVRLAGAVRVLAREGSTGG